MLKALEVPPKAMRSWKLVSAKMVPVVGYEHVMYLLCRLMTSRQLVPLPPMMAYLPLRLYCNKISLLIINFSNPVIDVTVIDVET